MLQGVQEKSFLDGFAVGELEARLKYSPTRQLKQWIPAEQINLLKGVLQKYNYTIVGISTHPSNSDEVLIVADKFAEGKNPNLRHAFLQDDRFMDGWKAGYLASLLRYKKPDQVEQLITVSDLDFLQAIIEEHRYVITSQSPHPINKNLITITATRSQL
jgi:hypothetical protein